VEIKKEIDALLALAHKLDLPVSRRFRDSARD
jgi:hypothetical protein